MTSRRIAYVITSVALVAVTAAGCSVSAPSKFYTLDSTATPDGAPIAHARVVVGPVTIPAAVDRPEFVVQVAPNRVEVDEFNRWIAPLNDAVARSVAGDLVVMLGTPDVATAPLAGFNPAYQVTIDIQRFDSIRGEAAVLEAVWSVRKMAGNETRSGRTVAREPVQGQGFEALASAHSRAIAKMSGEIAAAIRSESEQQGPATAPMAARGQPLHPWQESQRRCRCGVVAEVACVLFQGPCCALLTPERPSRFFPFAQNETKKGRS